MLQAISPLHVSGRSFFHSLRFEILIILVGGVVLPAWLALAWDPNAVLSAFGFAKAPTVVASAGTARISLVCAILCALAMIMVLRRFKLYPGVPVARSILPVLGSFYAIFLAVILVFRLDYSSKILIACFLGTLVFRYAIETLHIRAKGIFYSIVPGGKVDRIMGLPRTPTIFLDAPILNNRSVGAIIADLHADLEPQWERFLAEAALSGRAVYHYRQVWEAETGKVQISHLSENTFGSLIPSLLYQKLKRSVDIVACVLLMPLVFLLIAGSAIAIRLDSPGAVFFRQRRMGFRGKGFYVLKLRTMTEANDGNDRERSITLSDDLRITRVGRFLRKSRLDELPQIFNILRGEMSWIGPRPEAVSLSRWYETEIPFYQYRHIVRPGITGWAQVNQGHVASIDEVHDKLQYDFYYVKNLSYWLDIVIALRTLRVILSGFGAK